MNGPTQDDADDIQRDNRVTCPECKGKGWLRDFDPPGTYTCPVCGGERDIPFEEGRED